MAGIAFIEGEITHSGERHLLTLLCDHSGILPVDFRSQRCFTQAPQDVNFEHLHFWPVAPANRVRKLKISINRLVGVREQLFSKKDEKEDGQPSENFNHSGGKLPNCIEAIARALISGGINWPLGDLSQVSDEAHITAAIRRAASGPYDRLNVLDNGEFVMISPSSTHMGYDQISGMLKAVLSQKALAFERDPAGIDFACKKG